MIRVMIVDDQKDVRFLIRVIVGEDPGIEVVAEADSVRAAEAAIAEAAPDVVILDAMMPIADGYDAAPRLRAIRPDQRIVLCTAHVDEEVRRRAAAAGILHVIDKDEFGRLPAIVRAIAGGTA